MFISLKNIYIYWTVVQITMNTSVHVAGHPSKALSKQRGSVSLRGSESTEGAPTWELPQEAPNVGLTQRRTTWIFGENLPENHGWNFLEMVDQSSISDLVIFVHVTLEGEGFFLENHHTEKEIKGPGSIGPPRSALWQRDDWNRRNAASRRSGRPMGIPITQHRVVLKQLDGFINLYVTFSSLSSWYMMVHSTGYVDSWMSLYTSFKLAPFYPAKSINTRIFWVLKLSDNAKVWATNVDFHWILPKRARQQM